ncbi:MAG: rubredoxin [Flavobacteriales bacterium]|nr:rubredoxin [Flavobacteriales bacterium]
MKSNLHRIIVKGGVLSLGDLREIIEVAESLDLDTVSFGSRQDVVLAKQIEEVNEKTFGKLNIIKSNQTGNDNIVSSYVSSDIFPNTYWLTANKYLYVLESFRHQPNLKVNITDPKQGLVPLFTGNLNFIASEQEDYWFLYVKLPGWEEQVEYPALIYSWDLAKVAQKIEELLVEEPDSIDMLFALVSESVSDNNRTIQEPLKIPFRPFPYYEGMNKVGDEYWLGLYWRNNKYDIKFLKAMCDLCAECRIGKISLTPWKSFIVKGIPMAYKLQWEKFLGRFGINVRHSLLELNWHIPLDNADARNTKTFLVRSLDQNDISTYGLTFSVLDYTKEKDYFTSIVIEKNPAPKEVESIIIRDTYNVLYAKHFDPNTRTYIAHVQDVDKVELPGLLMELSKKYFEELGTQIEDVKPSNKTVEKTAVKVHQCQECLTVYDATIGDDLQGVVAGTEFKDLPDDYVCSMCEAPKSSFETKALEKEVS